MGARWCPLPWVIGEGSMVLGGVVLGHGWMYLGECTNILRPPRVSILAARHPVQTHSKNVQSK